MKNRLILELMVIGTLASGILVKSYVQHQRQQFIEQALEKEFTKLYGVCENYLPAKKNPCKEWREVFVKGDFQRKYLFNKSEQLEYFAIEGRKKRVELNRMFETQ